MSRLNALSLTLALLALSAPGPLAAQTASPPERSTFWGFAALGVGGAFDSTYYAAGIGGALQRRRLVFMARIASVGPEKENRMGDVALLAGWGTRPGPLHFAVAAGLGVARDYRDSTALTLPIEAQATWRFSSLAGVGVRGFASINDVASFGGVALNLQVGRLQ